MHTTEMKFLSLWLAMAMWASSGIADLSAGLLAYYPFSGSAQDVVAGANNGTVIGATLTSDRFGAPNSAYYFDGVNDEIDLGLGLVVTGRLTVTAWVRLDEDANLFGGDWQGLTLIGSQHAAGYGIEIYQSEGKWQWVAHIAGAWQTVRSDSVATLGQWCHVAGVYDGQHSRLYVNGILQTAQRTVSGRITASPQPLMIGANPEPGVDACFFKGKIDEVRVYNRDLSAQEVADLYALSGTGDPSLLLHYPCNADTGGVVLDHSGLSHTGVITGAQWRAWGAVGGGYEFDGIDDAIRTPHATDLNVTSQMTVCAWIKADLQGLGPNYDFVTIVDKSNGTVSNGSFGFYLHNRLPKRNSITFSVATAAGVRRTLYAQQAITNENWHHVVAIYNNSEPSDKGQIFIDGQKRTVLIDSAGSGNVVNNALDLWVGSSPAEGRFNGMVDDVRMYKRALSAAEVLGLYTNGWATPGQTALLVSGAPGRHGSVSPYGYGTNFIALGTTVNLTVNSPADASAGVRYACTGWTGTGSVPPSGSTNAASFTLTNASTIVWQWQTQYQVTVAAGAGGTAEAAVEWVAAGDETLVTASPSPGYHFSSWSGDVPPASVTNNPLHITVAEPVQLTAVFAPDSLLTDLRLHYSFDEAFGPLVQDLSGNGNTGIVENAVWSGDGLGDGSAEFVATNDAVAARHSASLNFGPKVTVSTWVRAHLGELGPNYDFCSLVDKCNGWTIYNGFGISLHNRSPKRNSIFFSTATAGGEGRRAFWVQQAITNEGWHHVVAIYDDSNIAERGQIFIDGVKRSIITDAAGTGNILNNALDLQLGRSTSHTFPGGRFNGRLDDVQIWARALSAAEVLGLYTNGWNALSDVRLVVEGVPEPHGTSSPYDYGTNVLGMGSAVNLAVSSPADESAGARFVCTGWTGTGAVPATGTGTVAQFTLTENSSIAWQWAEENWIGIATSGPGSVDLASGWYTSGTSITMTASGGVGYGFAGWTGDVPAGDENDNPLVLPVDGPRNVTATFDLLLPSFAVTQPGAGMRRRPGDVLNVAWQGALPLGHVDITLTRTGSVVKVLGTGLAAPTSSMLKQWRVTLGTQPGSGYRIRVTDSDHAADTAESAVFSITACSPGDFDGDGRSDLTLYNGASGNWFVKSLAGPVLAMGANWGFPGVTPRSGDFDGDGTADMVVCFEPGGAWFVKSLKGNTPVWNVGWGGAAYEPLCGDFDGDGFSDLAAYARPAGTWYVLSTRRNLILVAGMMCGVPGGQPVVADFNGDRLCDVGVFNPGNGNWYIKTAAGVSLASAENWGAAGYYAVPGDYDGDGKADLAVYDPLTANWHGRTLADKKTLFQDLNWGFASVKPVAGDFDGDGKADLAVYHQASGSWYIRTVAGKTLAWEQPWGWIGADPVPNPK